MNKILAGLCLILIVNFALADGYGGVGAGLSEACRTKYQPSFSGGDCINPNLTIRGLVGHEFNEYLAIEGSVDFSFDAGNVADVILGRNDQNSFFYDPVVESKRWAILTLAMHPLILLPVTDSFRLFAGPSVGCSIVDFDYNVKYFGDSYSKSTSTTEFGFNYGWTAGAELFSSRNSALRLQWQNWRSLDAKVAVDGQFNSNTVTLNLINYF